MSKEKRAVLWASLALWCFWLLWMLLFRRLDSARTIPLAEYAKDHLGLVPFHTISAQIRWALEGDLHAISNLGGNTLLFLPVGWALPVLLPKLRRFGRFLLTFAAVILMVELAQLFLRVGVCEVDDVFLNCVGASVGYLIWTLCDRKENGQC